LLQEKRREDLWYRAINILKSGKGDRFRALSREDFGNKYEPFKTANIANIKKGYFNLSKVPEILLEVDFIENVG
jgi:hypothetical protein